MIEANHVLNYLYFIGLLFLYLFRLHRPLLDRFLSRVHLTELLGDIVSLFSYLFLYLVFFIVFESVNHVPKIDLIVGIDFISAFWFGRLNILSHGLRQLFLIVITCR